LTVAFFPPLGGSSDKKTTVISTSTCISGDLSTGSHHIQKPAGAAPAISTTPYYPPMSAISAKKTTRLKTLAFAGEPFQRHGNTYFAQISIEYYSSAISNGNAYAQKRAGYLFQHLQNAAARIRTTR
jgi:hypothetical protein